MWCVYQCQMLIVAGLLLPMSALAQSVEGGSRGGLAAGRIIWSYIAAHGGIASSGPGGNYGHLCPQD